MLWPNGPVCPHCGSVGKAAELQPRGNSRTHARGGTYQCRACRKQFSVTVGTIFEDSRIPLNKWLQAVCLMCTTDGGISATSLQKELELGSYRSARFMFLKIRWALSKNSLADLGSSKTIQISLAPEQAIIELFLVKPDSETPRPGKARQRSVWAEVNEGIEPINQPVKARILAL